VDTLLGTATAALKKGHPVTVVGCGPGAPEAARALQTAGDMLAQSHTVILYLLQDAVRLCSGATGLQSLITKSLSVHGLTADAELRGITLPSPGITESDCPPKPIVF